MSAGLIDAIETTAYRVPTPAPEADGTLCWTATELVVVRVRSGTNRGLGYSYTAGRPAAALIDDLLAPEVLACPVMDIQKAWLKMNRALRNAGRQGLGMMALSAVDQALWDLKAKCLGQPLTTLWGICRDAIPVYGSGGFINEDDGQLRTELEQWLNCGIAAVKIKIGAGLDEDLRRVAEARAAVGAEVQLMVDANGAYSPPAAAALSESLGHLDVCWFEEPVTSDDIDALGWLRDRAPPGLAIAAGEYGWDSDYFRRLLEAGAVHVLQADATRCGYTGFLQVSSLCAAFRIPLSAHCAPALHASLGAAIPELLHLEYFRDHVRVESLFFDNVPVLDDGRLYPDLNRTGHGLTLRETSARPYRL